MLKHNLLFCFITASLMSATYAEDAANDNTQSNSDSAIIAWAHEQHGHNVYEPVQVFYGDYTGDGVDDALAWILYPSGGNSDFLDVALFHNKNGRLVFDRSINNVFGGNPRDVVFTPEQITLTTTVHKQDEPRCCPTGERQWVIETENVK